MSLPSQKQLSDPNFAYYNPVTKRTLFGPTTLSAWKAAAQGDPMYSGSLSGGHIDGSKSGGSFGGGAAPAVSAFSTSGSGWLYPLPSGYTQTQGYSWNGSSGHPGVDFADPLGTPFEAVADGVVTFVGPAQGYGNHYIEIDHGNGIVSYYGHAEAANVQVGQHVTAGQTIGLVGSEGWSTGPHLHFGVKLNGQIIDPNIYLKGAGAGLVANGISATLAGVGGATQDQAWDRSSIAAAMGLSSSLFDSNPELRAVLDTVESENLTPDTDVGRARFTALLQSTQWYKTKTDQQRKWELLSKADPAEAKQEFVSALGTIIHAANTMGIQLNVQDEWKLAYQKASLAWTDDEMKYAIAAHFKTNQSGLYGGDAGKIADDIWKQAADYGMPMNPATVGFATAMVLNGKATQQDYENHMKNYAAGMFPAYKAEIMGGKTVRDIAQPYLTVYQQTLEQNPDAVDLSKDPTIRKALSYQAPTTGTGKPGEATPQPAPTPMPLWQFEQQLKNDPRWLGTDNAQKSVVDAGASVLKSMGLTA